MVFLAINLFVSAAACKHVPPSLQDIDHALFPELLTARARVFLLHLRAYPARGHSSTNRPRVRSCDDGCILSLIRVCAHGNLVGPRPQVPSWHSLLCACAPRTAVATFQARTGDTDEPLCMQHRPQTEKCHRFSLSYIHCSREKLYRRPTSVSVIVLFLRIVALAPLLCEMHLLLNL